MKLLVDELPKTCSKCLFLGELKSNKTGCLLLQIKIPFEIGITSKLGICPLKES